METFLIRRQNKNLPFCRTVRLFAEFNILILTNAYAKYHKKYMFGSKVSIASTRHSKIILGALVFVSNEYDGHTLLWPWCN